MKRDLTKIVCCPVHKSKLSLKVEEEKEGEVLEGTLTCKKCGFAYPISEGIPNLLPPEYHVDGVRS